MKYGVRTLIKTLAPARIFALKGFTIKVEDGKFLTTTTHQNEWTGPYKSFHHAAIAIARKLSREFVHRNNGMQKAKEVRP